MSSELNQQERRAIEQTTQSAIAALDNIKAYGYSFGSIRKDDLEKAKAAISQIEEYYRAAEQRNTRPED